MNRKIRRLAVLGERRPAFPSWAAERFARRFLKRKPLDDALDWVRFRIDTFPRRPGVFGSVTGVGYQPLPWVGLAGGTRRGGTESRWAAMEPLLDELHPGSALDIGCNAGWFTLSLAARGIPTLGVDSDPKFYRTVLYALKRARLTRAGVIVLRIEPETVSLLPFADCVLLLSIWHHFVRHFSFQGATEILAAAWERTGRVLFFDTGEEPHHPEIALPEMSPDPRTWLHRYLAEVCAGGRPVHLGLHDAVAPDGGTYSRNLFAVVRERSGGPELPSAA